MSAEKILTEPVIQDKPGIMSIAIVNVIIKITVVDSIKFSIVSFYALLKLIKQFIYLDLQSCQCICDPLISKCDCDNPLHVWDESICNCDCPDWKDIKTECEARNSNTEYDRNTCGCKCKRRLNCPKTNPFNQATCSCE